jgi:cellulose biosynthesis protein BcsQ
LRIIAVYSIKGGVGKTAAAVNLAYLSAAGGSRTLIWDLDPQGAATFYLRVKPKVKGGGKSLAQGRADLDALVKATDFEGLDLLPADFSMRNMDLMLEDAKRPTKQLLRLLRPLSGVYDTVFLDCPPSISLLSENVFRAADLLLVPTVPTTLSVRTLDQLMGFLEEHVRASGLEVLPFFSMVNAALPLQAGVMERVAGRYPRTLRSAIPLAADVEYMGVHRMPLPVYAPDCPAALAYQALWGEVLARG